MESSTANFFKNNVRSNSPIIFPQSVESGILFTEEISKIFDQ